MPESNLIALFPSSREPSNLDAEDIARALLDGMIDQRFKHPKLLLSTVRVLCSPSMFQVFELLEYYEYGPLDWFQFPSFKESIKKIPLSEALDALEMMGPLPEWILDNTAVDSWNEPNFLGLLRSVLPESEPGFLAFLDEVMDQSSSGWEHKDFPHFVRLAKRLYL